MQNEGFCLFRLQEALGVNRMELVGKKRLKKMLERMSDSHVSPSSGEYDTKDIQDRILQKECGLPLFLDYKAG